MGTTASIDVLENGSATSSNIVWPGGLGTLIATGTFSSATLTLQALASDNVTWVDVGADTTMTADGIGNFELGAMTLRLQVTGSPTGVYARITGVTY